MLPACTHYMYGLLYVVVVIYLLAAFVAQCPTLLVIVISPLLLRVLCFGVAGDLIVFSLFHCPQHAAAAGHVHIVSLLLEKGAAIDAVDLNGDTALYVLRLKELFVYSPFLMFTSWFAALFVPRYLFVALSVPTLSVSFNIVFVCQTMGSAK